MNSGTYYYSGGPVTFSNITQNGSVVFLLCGTLTVNKYTMNGSVIVVEPGASLTINNTGGASINVPIVNYGTLTISGGSTYANVQDNQPIWNYGTLNVNSDLTINSNGAVYNAYTTSVVKVAGDMTGNGPVVNNGQMTVNGNYLINSNGTVCMGGGSNITVDSLFVNPGNDFTITPNGSNTTAGFTIKKKLSANNTISTTSKLVLCEAPGIDTSAAHNRTGSATVEPNCNAIVLPVTLVSFSAQTGLGNACMLTWVTSMERDVTDFDLEYSMDGKDFMALAVIDAHQQPSTYTYPTTLVGRTWFRLRIDNKDGSSSYSQVVEADYLGDKAAPANTVLVQPNLVTGSTLNVWSSMQTAQSGEWVVVDMAGRVVLHEQAQLAEGSANTAILLPNLARGMYYLLFQGSQVKLKPVPFSVIH
ncbi:MAG TPA: hypothetical protein VL547_21340 [Dinghuibacter sp.]|uniref:hypothetical protein n=1 Tax=Dinghuibacter sp. TaxID=2024697 RepID=UPI002D037E8F|nr:hypothetical protein [Dinghuibacter sp.]HTJ14604.1 hypothetical protein [Dinghuibacter sp.]